MMQQSLKNDKKQIKIENDLDLSLSLTTNKTYQNILKM